MSKKFQKFGKLKKEDFLRTGIKEACTAHNLTVCSFLRTRCWNKIILCVRGGALQGEEEPLAHRSLVGFCCSQEDGSVVGPEVPDENPFSAPSPRGAVVQNFSMHEYSWVSPGVG